MALIKLSAIGITTISGKTDGQVFANSGRGRYVKNFTMPTNPMTAAQQLVRAAFAAISQAWRQLTAAQRTQWNEAAPGFPILNRLGDVIILSGQMLYQQLNLNLVTIGEATIPVPPAQVGAQEIAATGVVADTAGGTMVITYDQNIDASNKVIVQATPPVSAGVSNVNSLYKKIAVFDDGTLDPIAFTADLAIFYTAVFGALPPAGSKIFVNGTPINLVTGERGTPAHVEDIAA